MALNVSNSQSWMHRLQILKENAEQFKKQVAGDASIDDRNKKFVDETLSNLFPFLQSRFELMAKTNAKSDVLDSTVYCVYLPKFNGWFFCAYSGKDFQAMIRYNIDEFTCEDLCLKMVEIADKIGMTAKALTESEHKFIFTVKR